MSGLSESESGWRSALKHRPRLTFRGRCLLTGSLTALVVSIAVYDPVLMQLSLIGLLLLLVALPLAWFNLRNLEYTHAFPSSVHRNEAFVVEMRLSSLRLTFGSADIQVRDGLIPRHWHAPALFEAVRPLSSITRWQSSRVSRRGVFGNFRYIMFSRYPLGLYQSVRWSRLPSSIVVYPRPVLTRQVRELLEVGVGFGGVRNSVSPSHIGEFKAMREYRMGDHAKRISWPFSARFQKLIVKELEQPCPREVSVVFHSYAPAGKVLSKQSFENSLQLLSGLFEYFSSHFIPFEFTSSFGGWRRIAVTSDLSSRRRAQILLATAKMQVSRDLHDLVSVVRSERRGSVVQVVVSNSPVSWWCHSASISATPVMCLDSRGVVEWSGRAVSVA